VPRILFGVSPVGLGHATRALVLARELERRGAEVRLFSGGKAAAFLKGKGFQVDDVVGVPILRIANGTMSQVSLWYLTSWLAHRRTLGRTRKLVDDYRPDLVIGDEEFSGVTVAGDRGIRRVFIADELGLGFARSWLARRLERRVEGWYSNLQRSVDLLIVPEEGEDHGNCRYVGPIVRPATMSCPETRTKYGIPGGRVVLFSMSGSGVGRELGNALLAAIQDAGLNDVSLVVTGNRGARVIGERVYDLGLVEDNQNIVACADLVVSNAGKSTIDEAAAGGTPIIAIPIRHHVEQERNAAALGYTYTDLRRLSQLVAEKIGKKGTSRQFRGEVAAADAIFSLLGRP
jgi:UDP-N-acetylglucosamine--N-acetylmuramyl-(pentapeptide) pyrophosphoryl-undecaprenol N-acetylglucosamine transferase